MNCSKKESSFDLIDNDTKFDGNGLITPYIGCDFNVFTTAAC